ncbi:hypothetical protein QLQ12_36585 [Actinoplanes sp. NEAU-A12]|uniref:Ig-like domain-containing protein n=1 Tax=Actinoplanes sandaracinus TaxID=3045177 RepID=A0ABT6WWJ7_9ACTN|nr:hypothetical protein [Actinoplanes sandaracinus]MDI6104124.1 hypothetical protein [Actinoplanes sandaracinus]
MSGNALTANTAMQCPHGGQVRATPSNTRAKSDAHLLTSGDTFTVAGCPFTLPPGAPSPCLSVTWIVADLRVTAGSPTLSESAAGMCLSGANVPQGPVSVVTTQRRVGTR